MNAQREVIYRRRNNSLFGERLRIDISNMIYDTCENIVYTNKGANDYKNFEFELIKYFSVTTDINTESFESMQENDIIDKVYTVVLNHYLSKIENNAKLAYPVIKHVYEKQREKLLGQVPVGRLGTSDEVASAVIYLAASEASYLTGSTLHVNGGMAMI